MKYLSGFVTGFLAGGGAVCAALLYLHWSEVIDLHMLDKDYVRKMYQPKGPWIRDHFDYSYHGRHYSPYHSTVTEAKPAWRINPECSGCVYEGMSADFDPCKSCKRAFDDHFKLEACEHCKHKGALPNDWPCSKCGRVVESSYEDCYEYRGDEPEAEAEESHEGQCYRCKHFEDETLESPCNDCKWAFPYGDTTHEDHFEADEED